MLRARGIAVPSIMDQLHLVLPRAVRNKPLGDAGFAAMVPALSDNAAYDPRFKLLGLHLMALTEASAAGLAAVLKSNTKLETLQLGGNTLGDRGASVVAQAAAASQSLRVVEMSRNRISAEGLQRVLWHFKCSPSSNVLTKLDISGNPGSKAPEILAAVSDLLLHREQLHLGGGNDGSCGAGEAGSDAGAGETGGDFGDSGNVDNAGCASTAGNDADGAHTAGSSDDASVIGGGEKRGGGLPSVVVQRPVLTSRYCDAVELQVANLVVVL